MADVNANYYAVLGLRWSKDGTGLEFFDPFVDVLGVVFGKGEECFVASASEGEDGLLPVDFHLFGVFVVVIEGAAECVGGCCC